MKKIISSNVYFIIPYILFIIAVGIAQIGFSKENIHLFINAHNNSFFDLIFPIITFLGDGWTAVIVSFTLLFYEYRASIYMFISYIVSSAFTQLLKHVVFDDALRPVKFFENAQLLHRINGVEPYMFNSFPSGHATTAFSVCFTLSLISSNKIVKVLLFASALTISFSRVYISQHFLEDIYVGSLIGTTVAGLTFVYFGNSRWLNSKPWIDQSLLKQKK